MSQGEKYGEKYGEAPPAYGGHPTRTYNFFGNTFVVRPAKEWNFLSLATTSEVASQ